MDNYAYSPHTSELIRTDAPADWMGTTDVAPPDFDPSVSGCFWREDHWEIVFSGPAPKPITTVSPWQIRKALNTMSLRDAVESAVLASDQTTKDAWQYATEFVRTDPLVSALGYTLGKTDEELDALFELAATL